MELLQSNLPIQNVLRCRATLIRTSLAYVDQHQRLKVLMPIREYMQKTQPLEDKMLQPLFMHFKELLGLSVTFFSSQVVARLSSNYANIYNIVLYRLQCKHPDLRSTIYCICDLNSFSQLTNRGSIPLFYQIPDSLPSPCDHMLETYFINQLFKSWKSHPIPDPKALVMKALEHFTHFDDTELQCVFSYI